MSFLNCFSHKLSAREERKLKLSDEFQKSGVSSNYNGLADTGLHIEEVPDSEYKRNSDLSGFDTAREHDSSPPTAMAELTTAQAKSNNFQGMKQPLDPSLQFVKELPSHPEYRQASALQCCCLNKTLLVLFQCSSSIPASTNDLICPLYSTVLWYPSFGVANVLAWTQISLV